MEGSQFISSVNYLRWIPCLPLLGAALLGVLGWKIQRRFGKRAVHTIACALPLLSFILSLRVWVDLGARDPQSRVLLDKVAQWISIGSLRVDIAFLADPLSCLMILVVSGIGTVIHFYSIGYMHEDESYWRFFAFLNLFTFAMLTLVLADNLLLMFVGWEGVGLCSYALIGFWYKDKVNTTAGNKAFIVNRVGDFGFILGIFLLFWSLVSAGEGTLVFREIGSRIGTLEGMNFAGLPVAALIGILLFVGAAGKSAQLPLYVWLPDAMQGPTPVSALIHAATMVTAGVYMIARMHLLYSAAPLALEVVAWIGALTALGAATVGVLQNDIKRVLAYSTISQLGYMFMGVGVGAYAAGMFHLFTHAFFKACLFLGAGSVIHAMGGEQDMRRMGGLRRHLPSTYMTFLVSTLAIAGIFPLSGFFSKDEILWRAWQVSPGIWLMGVAGAGLTAFYMFRQVFMTFFGNCRADEHTRQHLHESPAVMTIPLWILAGGAATVGFLGVPRAFPLLGDMLGGSSFEHWLEPVFGGPARHEGSAGTERLLMAVSLAVAGAGIWLAWAFYLGKVFDPEALAQKWKRLYLWVYNKYYVDELYNAVFLRGTLAVSRLGAWFDLTVIDGVVNGAAYLTTIWSRVTGLFDFKIIDGIVNGIANSTWDAGGRVRRLQTGSINAYLYLIVGAVTVTIIARLW